MSDEEKSRLRDMIQGALGVGRPFVLIYDGTPIDMIVDGNEEQNTVVSRITSRHQSTALTVGLLDLGLKFLEWNTSEYDEDDDDDDD